MRKLAPEEAGGYEKLRHLVEVHDRLRNDVREVGRVPVLAVSLARNPSPLARFVFGKCAGRYRDPSGGAIWYFKEDSTHARLDAGALARPRDGSAGTSTSR